MTTATPVRYSADLEQINPNEQEVVSGLNDAFDVILKRTAEDYGHAVRSVHAKAHGILKAKMIVRDNLPAELAQGLFSRSGNYDVYMRMSTNAGDILPDAIALPRGLAMKVVGVEGPRLSDAAGRLDPGLRDGQRSGFPGAECGKIPRQSEDARQDNRPDGRDKGGTL
ncbi:hypothetical protein [Rhizobium sp. 21-4511-3d]